MRDDWFTEPLSPLAQLAMGMGLAFIVGAVIGSSFDWAGTMITAFMMALVVGGIIVVKFARRKRRVLRNEGHPQHSHVTIVGDRRVNR